MLHSRSKSRRNTDFIPTEDESVYLQVEYIFLLLKRISCVGFQVVTTVNNHQSIIFFPMAYLHETLRFTSVFLILDRR
jgi:hypothetical protein